MRNLIITSVALSAIFWVFQWMFFSDAPAPASAGAVTAAWETDLDAALDEGGRRGRPVLALWTRDDSTISATVESHTLAAPAAQLALAQFIAVRIDAATHPQLKDRLHAPGTPYIVVFFDGREVDAFTPSADPDGLATQLAHALARR